MKKQELISKDLNDKQRLFCLEYVLDYNGTRAYKKAYGINNDNVAHASANRLLQNVTIQRHCKYFRDHVEEVAGVSKILVLNELKKIAFSSIAHLHNNWITRKEFETLSEEDKAAIQSIETQTRTEKVKDALVEVDYVKIKLYNKQAAIDSINKMMGYNMAEKFELTSIDSVSFMTTDELIERANAVKQLKTGE
jgi:phage terminase small subunit